MVRPAVREVVAAELERLAGHDVTPGHDELHHYWTKGEGLAKWVHSAHPWTALYHHLVKHVPPEMAKRMASAWFHEVLGFWPGTPHVGAVPTPKAGRSAAIREIVAAEVDSLLRKFNPREPRDPEGKWTLVGAAGHAIAEAFRGRYAERESALKNLHGEPVVTPLEGGISSKVSLRTYPDGTRVVRKEYPPDISGTLASDAEELAARVLDAFGVPAPAVHRVNDHTIDMEFVPGMQGGISGELKAPRSVISSPDGRRLGLADAVLGHRDRGGGNWMKTADGHIIAVDNGNAFEYGPHAAHGNPFVGYLMTSHGWATNTEVDRSELAAIRVRIERLRPQFERLGRTQWHDEMLSRLDAIERNAANAPKAGRSALISEIVAAELEVLRKFDPHQPRVPKGAPGGGQFGKVAHAISEAVDDGLNRPPHQNGHGGGVRPVLAEAKGIREINKAIAGEIERITGRQVPVNLSGSDPQIAREHGEGVLRGLERFPKTPITRITSYGEKSPGVIGGLDKLKVEHAFAFQLSVGGGDWLAFNNRYAANREHYYELAKLGKDSGFSVTSGPVGVGLHEFGHSLARRTGAEDPVHEKAAAISRASKQSARTHVSRKLSRYATKNKAELSAEAFADVMLNGSSASAMSHDLFGIIESRYNDWIGQ